MASFGRFRPEGDMRGSEFLRRTFAIDPDSGNSPRRLLRAVAE